MTRRRLIAWGLTLLALPLAGLAYPYVRYRAVTDGSRRYFEDRWREPAQDYPIAWCSYRVDGTIQGVTNETGTTMRKVDAYGAVIRAMTTLDNGRFYEGAFEPNGAFRRGIVRHGGVFLRATEAEAREALGPLLEPDGMPWPWWVRLPYFAGHLRGD